MSARVPRGLHPQGVRNVGGAPFLPPRTSPLMFGKPERCPIHNGTGQQIIAGAPNAGTATVVIGPQGLGARWYPSQVQVSTSSGPTDGSTCVVYKLFVAPTQIIGQTLQGGGDTFGWTHEMQPGELIFAVWADANPGDIATLTINGDQVVLV